MSTIRELFHEIGNWHNKITLGAGVTRLELKREFKDKPLPKETEKLIEKLTELEHQAVEANNALIQLKNLIYDIIDPDSDKPRG